jgi:hypothetical protein
MSLQNEPTVPLQLNTELDGKLLVVQLSGKLHKLDYARFVPAFEAAVKKFGKLRVLMEMHDFYGGDIGAALQDIQFDVKHFNDIERLAMVGEKQWERWMAMFWKPFTTATVRYFPQEQSAEAQAWIAGE